MQSREKTDISFSRVDLTAIQQQNTSLFLKCCFISLFDYRKICETSARKFLSALFKTILDSKTRFIAFHIFSITLIFIFTALIIINYRIILYVIIVFISLYRSK